MLEELPTDETVEDGSTEYGSLSSAVVGEISEVLSRVDAGEVQRLVEEILAAEKVFFIAVGRVFLSLQCMAKRLAHLGIKCEVVGSITEKAITDRDILIAASGSGESIVPVEIARKAKRLGARLALITSARASTLKSLSDVVVHLPCPTKNDPDYGVQSMQPMTTLFDQSLHVFGDTVALMVQKKAVPDEQLWKYHANLE
ncbi:MAG: SIS domain-containing protein [Candidatus Aenigmarchaeota archaeon]|nr:SIS domain-containing protein [Candidatus Aenigmarchaeota archaeon]